MALGFELPIFANGIASAQELNKLSIAQEYINNVGAFNYAFPQMIEDDVRYLVHRHKYLHWYVFTGNAELYVNTVKVAECDSQRTYGSVDIDALGVPFNDVYAVKWDKGDNSVAGIYILEHPARAFGISYPYPLPAFANNTVLTATDLNYVSGNMKYLMDIYSSGQGCGFTRVAEERLNEFGGPGDYRQEWHYWIRHEYRYLYVATDRRAFGDPGGTRRIKLLINGGAYYQDTDTYVQWWPHAVALDLSGAGDNYAYQGSNNPMSAPAIAKGQWYKLTVFMQTQKSGEKYEGEVLSDDEAYIHIAGEMPARDWI